ncbi:MAG: AAA family ATPase [Myxococcales bacterium]|nr:AAA family ATPase [Myxococcales bacterium]
MRESLERRGLVEPQVPRPETLHRILGYRPSDDGFVARREHPLDAARVIVDESSMVDVRLMFQLFEALEPDARLVLVGDPDQLPSIEAGAAFRDLVESHPEAVSTLQENLRVAASEGAREIADLAGRMREGRELRLRTVQDFPHPDADGVFFLETGPADRRRWLVFCEQSGTSRIILTPTREGPVGSDAINAALRSAHAGSAGTAGWIDGQPLMITKNLYTLDLYNGDLGRARLAAGGRAEAVFRSGTVERSFDLGAIAAYVRSADAMTVHKAQGSEFDCVLIQLPARPHPLVSRELLYTAVTRARRQVILIGSQDSLHAGARRSLARRTSARIR